MNNNNHRNIIQNLFEVFLFHSPEKIILFIGLIMSVSFQSISVAQINSTINPLLNELQFNGAGPDNYFGISVKNAGDVNGDGYEDIVIGAAYDGPGHAYIFYGGSNMNTAPDVIINNQLVNDNIGFSVSGAGDVNADGYSDVITGTLSGGKVYIFFGGPVMDNIPDMTFTEGPGDLAYGYSVARAGDVNGDGYDDFMISSGSYNRLTGRIYIFYGGPFPDNIPDVVLNGEAPNGFFGLHLSAPAGDVNGDGYDDIVTGAFELNSLNGKAYLFFGGTNMDTIADLTFTSPGFHNQFGYQTLGGDFNGDGYSDLVISEPFFNGIGRVKIYYGGPAPDNTADVIISGENTGDNFGCYLSVASDLNNDRIEDLIIGADGYDSYKGKACVYFGGANLGSSPDMVFTGETAGSRFGYSLSTAGDVNGDNKIDILVGAQGYNSYTGKSYLYISCPTQCEINGPSEVTLGSANNLFTCSQNTGYWSISNYGNTQGSISSDPNGDSVYVNAGNTLGHFVLYFNAIDSCGLGLCVKHVYVDSPLPVELASFTSFVIGNNVTLNWTTSSEENNSGFNLERINESGGQGNWESIAFIHGHGTISAQTNYIFEDRNLSTGKYNYRLKQTDFNGNFEYHELQNEVIIGIPEKYFLSQNYPNPFNPTTKLEFGIPELGFVSLKIYNTAGREVAVLVNELKAAGYYTLNFNASNLPSGVYYYRIESGKFMQVKKMVLLK
ncbi:MAG TPA: T9SS type A sorting domain-containing protein [Ignavibacteria bacterium]|nr:T9SS type A sorting domain-containing protein [Ignavibacteria bacterium]HMR39506.1 T9SS type A sorting domain-containing protein [Ignavibacteria bacterium]